MPATALTLNREKVLVAEMSRGFTGLTEFHVGSGKYGCILWIAVHPAFRRRGIVLTLTTVVVDALKKEGTKAVFALPKVEMQHAKGTLGKAQLSR